MALPLSTQRIYALAAMCQAAQLAVQLATQGQCDANLLKAQWHSIFIMNPKDVEQIYPHPRDLKLGLMFIDFGLKNPKKFTSNFAFPLVRSFCAMGKNLLASKKAQEALRIKLKRTEEQTHYFQPWDHPRIFQNLGEHYVEMATDQRINLKIAGQKKFLQNLEMLNKIRAVLLSGIRAAVLWYQLKGNLPWVFLNRRKIAFETQLLMQIP